MQAGLGYWGLWRSKGPSGRSWSPGDLGDKELWLKYNEGLKNNASPAIFPSDGDQIDFWEDFSGREAHATGTGANYPTWDITEEAADFSGTSDILELATNDIAISGEFSAYFRIKFRAGFSNTDVLTSDTDGTHFIRLQNTKALRMKIASGPLDFTWTNTVFETSSYHTIGIIRDSSDNIRLFADGVESTNLTTVNNGNTFKVNRIEGGSDVWLKSVIITSKALTQPEQDSLEAYLSTQ